MLVIGLIELGGAVAQIADLVPRGSQAVDQPGSAQRGRGALVPGTERRGAGGRANQGNLLRLTDDLDRQRGAPYFLECRLSVRAASPGRAQFLFPPGARVASSGGSVNRTSSRMRSRSR